MDFKRILVTDQLASEIFAAASRESLLFVRRPDEEIPTRRGRTAAERALSLVVLFDHLVIHDFSDGAFRVPDLENEGIVEIVPAHQPSPTTPALDSRWKKGRMGSRGRPPKALLRSLSLVQQFRPLVINRILTGKIEFIDRLAKALHVSPRNAVSLFLDYALAYVQGDEAAVGAHVLSKVFPDDLLREITDELFAFSDPLSPSNAILLFAIVFAEEIAVIQELSSKHKIGVATEHYGETFRTEPALKSDELDALGAANRFVVLRAAFADEGRFMPPITSLKQALKLRKDPNLIALREQLRLFHSGLAAGDRNAILEARREIQKARRRLERRVGWDKALRWLAYLSIPAGIAEGLVWGAPVAGTSLSVIGAAGAAISQRVEKKSKWVLFGT